MTPFVILLSGGNKKMQTRDIESAHDYWLDHRAAFHMAESGHRIVNRRSLP